MTKEKETVKEAKAVEKSNKNDFHAHHRERLRNRYKKNGIETFTQCEILEMLLFYAIPRKDTKPLAHALLESFGSLPAVLEATEKQLLDAGATKSSAFFLSFINDVESVLAKQRESREVYSDYDDLGRYMCALLRKSRTEQVFAVMLDAQNKLIGDCPLGKGDFDSVKIDLRKLIEQCICKGVAKVALAHNHPAGRMEASTDDYIATRTVESALKNISIDLVEHYIVCGKTYIGMKKLERAYRAGMDDNYDTIDEDIF